MNENNGNNTIRDLGDLCSFNHIVTTNGQAHVKKLVTNLELAVGWSVIIIFCFPFPDIPEKLRRRKRRRNTPFVSAVVRIAER